MFNQSKQLILALGCLTQLSAGAMEQAGPANPDQQQRPLPKLQQLANNAAAKTVVGGTPLYRTVDASKMHSLRDFSVIPEHLIPELERAAREYRDQHPGALPICGAAAAMPFNVDLLPQFRSSAEFGLGNVHNVLAQISMTTIASIGLISLLIAAGYELSCPELPDEACLETIVKFFPEWGERVKIERQALAKLEIVYEKTIARYNKIAIASFVAALTWPVWLPKVTYAVCKPTSRNIALGCAAAGLVGCKLYQKLKR